MEFDDLRYLTAKRSVDDRALNRGVLDALRAELARSGQRPLRVLELGAGVGTMAQRLAEWRVLTRAHYTLVDTAPASLAAAQRALGGACPFELEYVPADVYRFVDRPEAAGAYDLVIANAVLDLIDLPSFLPRLWRVLAPGAPYWFSINFDGETIFVPELALDAEVLALYHRSMDQRMREARPAGHSRTGRRLLSAIPASGATITAAGSSDWVVLPHAGAYPHDEAYFLHHIIHTIDAELSAHPDLDAAAFRAWVDTRHAQIDRVELRYVAHQLDLTGCAPGR